MRYTLILLVGFLFSCSTEERKRDEFFVEGNESLGNGRFQEAIEYYDNSLRADPSYAPALNNRGVAKIEKGDPYAAILDYNSALTLEPNYEDCLLNRAYAYEFIGQYSNAIRDIDALLSSSPDSAYYHFYKGLVLTKLRDYQGSLRSFRTSIDLGNEDQETLVNIGTVYYFLGQNDSAKYFLNKVLDENPKQPNALNTLSQMLLTEADLNGALYSIERALEVVPREPYFLNNRGLVYLEMDSLELGLKDINKSILLNTDNGWAYRNKGIYYLKIGEHQRAIELFERAEQSNEFIDELYYYKGLTYTKLNDFKKACEAWKMGAEAQEKRSVEQLTIYCN